jgi:hypothetical protein
MVSLVKGIFDHDLRRFDADGNNVSGHHSRSGAAGRDKERGGQGSG